MNTQPDTQPKPEHPVWECPVCGLVPDNEVDINSVHQPCGNTARMIGKTRETVAFLRRQQA